MNKLNDGQSVFVNGLWGISALAVLFGHVFSSKSDFLEFFPIQSYAVICFFALSGFIICYNCLIRENYSFDEYMIDQSTGQKMKLGLSY